MKYFNKLNVTVRRSYDIVVQLNMCIIQHSFAFLLV